MASQLYQAPAPQPIEQAEAPSFSLQQGCIQSCGGYLNNQSKFLKRWKKEWLKVIPGPEIHEIRVGSEQSSLHTFIAARPNLRVEPLSRDRKSKDFLGFSIFDTEEGKEINRFRAGDVVTMRKFMASLGCECDGLYSLGCECDGLFSRNSGGMTSVEALHGVWDALHPSEDELHRCQKMFNTSTKEKELANEKVDHLADALPWYDASQNHVPVGFYFPKVESTANLQSYSLGAAAYYPSTPSMPGANRRPWHDTFLPPMGLPVILPVSVGYGAEVGLQPGLQALWDPNKKTYFFIDHIDEVTFFEDPRSFPESPPIVEKMSLIYADSIREFIPSGVCNNRSVIEATSSRACSKPHGFVFSACGLSGNCGQDGAGGQKGAAGTDGDKGYSCGSSGSTGSRGGTGSHGGNGTEGMDGTAASDAILRLWGNSDELHFSGTCEAVAKLGGNKAEEILFVNCRGGDGGEGGRGGEGGKGGVGGLGGKGNVGCPGLSSSSGIGGRGGSGGTGGNGGLGGVGGRGGPGRGGGQAGFGGVCVFQTSDPTLLMLVDADCMCGSPGVGGEGGAGGNGGPGGLGGRGGPGGRGGKGGTYKNSKGENCRYANGYSGPGGHRGESGRRGILGQEGQRGKNGKSAKNGSILWVVNGPDGEVLRQAGARYDVEVTNLKVVSAVDDGVFEPNQRIMVSEVQAINNGGLPLPEGASTFMPSTNTIKFEPTRYDLPSDCLRPCQSHVIPVTFHGRIFDQPPPNAPGPFISSAQFHPRVELVGRPFEKSFLHQNLVVQYPVKLHYLRCSENLGRGEVSILEIGVQNISTMPYGSCAGSGGKVVVQLHLDARLIPVVSASDLNAVPYTITHNSKVRDSMYIQLHEIHPGKMVDIKVAVQIESRAELFERCHWQADLYLRDKLIEYNFKKVRVTPFYIPRDPPADVLMITSEAITRKAFVCWQQIFESLRVSVDFWDTTRYNGLSLDAETNSRHEVTWEGRYRGRMVLYPHCNLQQLHAVDIPRHFHGADFRDSTLRELHSSMLLFLPHSEEHGPVTEKFCDLGDLEVLKYLSAVEDTLTIPEDVHYGGKHIFKPGSHFVTSRPHLKWERNYLKMLEQEHPMQAPTVLSRQLHISSASNLHYKYGSVDIRHVPILRSSKFLVVDGAGGSMVNMGSDDAHLVPSSSHIPLASNYGQVFLLVLHGLPMFNKIQLLKNQLEKDIKAESIAAPLTFLLPNGATLSLPELTMITASSEISDEVYTYTGLMERMHQLAHSITEDVGAFINNGQVILQGLKLIKKEIKKRKRKVVNARSSLAVDEVKSHVTNIKHTLKRAGVKKNKCVLIPLASLVSQEHVHRTHQHWMEDDQEQWNLVGGRANAHDALF